MTFTTALLAVAVAMMTALQPTSDLAGTSWQLVRFQSGDDTVVTPSNAANYTMTFGTDGRVSVRIDCNRGSGTWASLAPGQLAFGPLALTRAMCPAGSMHDQIAKHWTYVRSYVFRDKRLFLSLMADGGIYEFEPLPAAQTSAPKLPVTTDGPFTFECAGPGGTKETVTATFYATEPGMVLVERGGRTRPAFSVPAASGARYEGPDVIFWEAQGALTLTWSGIDTHCTRH